MEKGQGLVEFAIVLLMVCIIVLIALTLMGPSITSIYPPCACTL
jgi:hypothetical protein